jgi:hypothetical protein
MDEALASEIESVRKLKTKVQVTNSGADPAARNGFDSTPALGIGTKPTLTSHKPTRKTGPHCRPTCFLRSRNEADKRIRSEKSG